jgi:hypothetical protein
LILGTEPRPSHKLGRPLSLGHIPITEIFFFFMVVQYWGLNSGPCALLLGPYCQPLLALTIFLIRVLCFCLDCDVLSMLPTWLEVLRKCSPSMGKLPSLPQNTGVAANGTFSHLARWQWTWCNLLCPRKEEEGSFSPGPEC